MRHHAVGKLGVKAEGVTLLAMRLVVDGHHVFALCIRNMAILTGELDYPLRSFQVRSEMSFMSKNELRLIALACPRLVQSDPASLRPVRQGQGELGVVFGKIGDCARKARPRLRFQRHVGVTIDALVV
jgi:hypothetical protein